METKKKILVAEDNASNFKLLDVILSKDFELLHAWNGKEAVEMFEQQKPELVLMDITMPVMNGYEATRAIRRLHDHADALTIPIIAMTANVFVGDERTSFDAGMNGYMVKPIATEDVANTIVRNIHQ